MEWKNEYSVDVKEIDKQHKTLIETINLLNTSINEMKTKETLFDILDKLATYTVEHFATEEKYFDKFNYEHTKEHKEEHSKFKKEVEKAIKKAKNNEMEVSFELIDFLEDWVINHVTGMDHEYVECFKKHGLK